MLIIGLVGFTGFAWQMLRFHPRAGHMRLCDRDSQAGYLQSILVSVEIVFAQFSCCN
jgi:hypothetical protein